MTDFDNQVMIGSIRQKLRFADMWTQLAEECSELAQVSLKMARLEMGHNPPAVHLQDLISNVYEEIADISLCLDVLLIRADLPDVEIIKQEKLKRWYHRLGCDREDYNDTVTETD